MYTINIYIGMWSFTTRSTLTPGKININGNVRITDRVSAID